jgi:hypothetical protein
MRKVGIILTCLAGMGMVAMFWNELPALRRYIKIARM